MIDASESLFVTVSLSRVVGFVADLVDRLKVKLVEILEPYEIDVLTRS